MRTITHHPTRFALLIQSSARSRAQARITLKERCAASDLAQLDTA
jgi:hypothetical protein